MRAALVGAALLLLAASAAAGAKKKKKVVMLADDAAVDAALATHGWLMLLLVEMADPSCAIAATSFKAAAKAANLPANGTLAFVQVARQTARAARAASEGSLPSRSRAHTLGHTRRRSTRLSLIHI